MCTNEQIENIVHKSWKKEHFFVSFLAWGIICACLFYHDGPLFLGINATLESSCAVFLFSGAICTELLWINDLHEQYSEIKKKKQEYVTEIVRGIAGVNNETGLISNVYTVGTFQGDNGIGGLGVGRDMSTKKQGTIVICDLWAITSFG